VERVDVKLTMLGCGRMARAHTRTARRCATGLEIRFASRSLEKARSCNAEMRGDGAFGSYEEACASADTDAVVVCTPHAVHADHVTLAAAHGKAILVEKPLARTLEEARRLARAAEAAGVPCMTAENYFFKPAVRTMRQWIESGSIGRPVLVEVHRARRQRVQGWRADATLMGGGALLEGGVHWINLLCSLGGEPMNVAAVRPDPAGPMAAPFEDTLQLSARFAGGAVGSLLHSWNLPNRLGGLGLSKVYGSEGTITFESNGLFALLAPAHGVPRLRVFGDITGMRPMMRHFLDCVRERRPPAMSLALGFRDMAVALAAYRSLETGCRERVASIAEPA
jgi:predicted dehydrogenase